MTLPEPHVREAGAGPGVVCLHSNASTSGQWRELMEQLAPTHHVLAPDSYGSGKTGEWPSDRLISLDDEVDLIEPVLARAGNGVVLVGHSYGAAIALVAALRNPRRVRALALYEPTLFSLVHQAQGPLPNDAQGIYDAVSSAAAALDAGDRDAAAQAFIDYWIAPGAWTGMPPARQAPIAASVANVRRWAHALTTQPTPIDAFRALDMPVLYMVGQKSTRAAHAVADILAPALPRVERVQLEGLGHMAPVLQPQAVNARIVDFILALED